MDAAADHRCTLIGVEADLNGKSVFELTEALLRIAHPKFREELAVAVASKRVT